MDEGDKTSDFYIGVRMPIKDKLVVNGKLGWGLGNGITTKIAKITSFDF